jgi:hypothetical protein
MKNPFEKKNNTLLIAGIALGAAAAGAAIYFFREEIGEFINEYLDKEHEPLTEPDPQAYLHHPKKAPKTDREALLHHDILHGPDTHESEHHEDQQS